MHAPTRLRWGLMGTARINRALIPAIRASDSSELVAVASRDLDVARRYAAEWNIPSAYGSYAELVAAGDVDAIYVPLPNHLHAEWTISAARGGKHVLCEKPLALTVAECDAIAEAAAASRVVVTEAFMYRHHPQTRRIKALVDGGALGPVHLVRGCFTFTLTRDADVRLRPEWGGGSLWDVGCYPVSFARYVLGAEPVEAFGWADWGPTGIDLTFTGQLRFADGRAAQFDCGFQAPFRTSVELVGRDATLAIPVPFKPGLSERVTLTRDGQAPETIAMPPEMLYLGEVNDVAAAAAGLGPPAVSLADSRGTVAAIEALYRSARTGRPEPVAG